ncbi:MAG: hypothetical protein KKH57_01265, partial [Candidatus Omnitrophica bacterium]|nr:hypothetical protein [Candidatus Omnitrophota bacterium]
AQAINKGYLNGLESRFPWEKQQIWQEYLKSHKQGEYKIQDTIFGLKRMYFSGGVIFDLGAASFPLTIIGQKELPDLLKQDPDFLSKLMKSDSFKNDLVVLTERQGNQENIGEQSLVQDINIVSSQGGTLEETIIQQAGKEKPEPLELTPKVEASSPVNPNLKAKVKKTFIMAVLACAIFFSNLQPALAHYFITGPQGKPQAVVEVWNKNTPADNTLGGIGKNILIAEGKKVTPQALYGKDGLVNKIAGENQIPNPDLLKANQQISISGLSSLTQEKLIRVQGLKKAQSDLEAGKMSIEEKNRKLESENLVLKEKLNDLDKRINNIGENTDRFDENNRKSLDDSGGSQKGIMYILAALGIGTVLLGLGLYRRRQRLEQFKAGISLKKEERDQLDAQIETQKQAIKELNAQIEKAKLALTEAEKKAQEINQRDREKELSVLLREEETRLAVLKENVTQLQKEQSQYEETIRTLKNNIAEYQQEIGGLEDKKDKTKQEGLSISEEAVTAAAYVDEVNQKITESEGILGGLKEEIIQLEANKNSLEAGIAVSQEKKIKFESELLTLDQRSQVLSQEIAALEAQRDTLARKEIELNASINEKNIRLKEIDEKISILPTAGQEEALQISALQEQKIQLEVELERLSQQVVDLNREYAQSQEKIELSKKSLAGLKQDSDAISAGIKEMSMKSSQLKNEIAALGDRKINLDEKVVNLNNTLANTQKELSDVQAILRGSLSDRDALRQEVEELGREKKELEIEVEKIRKSSVTKPPVEAPLTKDIEVISKAKQEYADIALQFQGVQNTTDKNVFTELCERLTAFTNSLDQLIRSEVSSERDRANQELRNASNRLIQAAKRIRDEIKIEIEALSQLDHSADFEAGVSQLQAKYPLEIFNEFTETIRKIREDIGLKEMVLEEQRAKEADLLGSFTARYQAIIEEIPQAASKDDLKEIMNKLDGLDGTVKANKQLSNILKPLQKEARDSISQREDELKVISKSLYRRISLSTLWQIFKHYFLVPWWIGSQLNNALSPQGLARKVSEIYSKYTTIIDWFNKQEFYRAFKHRSEQLGLSKEFDKSGAVAEFNVEGDPTPYHLELSDRSPEYLIRGYFSGDCTNPAIPFAHSSFQSATLNHLIMPGFLNFKVMRGKGWVGNIYAVVIEDKGKPVLLIDAVQVPWRVWGGIFLQPRGAYAPFWLPFKLFPIRTFRKAVRISDASLKALEKYAHNSGFNQIWHSEFVSNFYDFKDYYDNIAKERKYQESPSINSNMIIGWPEIQRDMHLSALYIESLNRKAWRIWTKEETQVKQTLATDSRPLKAPQAEVVMPQSPEQVIKGISEGKYITQDTQELLNKIFGVTPAYLSKALSQRFSESGKFKKVLGILGSGQTIAQWMRQNKRESGYDAFESQLKQLGIDPEFDNSNTLAFGVNNDERKYYLISS